VKPVAPVKVRGNGPLSGQQFVITGALSRPRSEIEEMIKLAGGKTSSSVSKHTSALITEEPESNSSKMKKARELGVPIWGEKQLVAAIGAH
jgi:DNA ligase (NAD+)